MESELRLLKSTFDDIGENNALIELLVNMRRSKLSILDVGCGDGSTLRKLCSVAAQHGAQVRGVGVDPNAPLCESSSKLEFQNVRFEDYLPTESFDVILCKQALYYLGRPLDAVGRMLSLLNKDGVLCIVVWSEQCSLFLLSKIIGNSNAEPVTTESLAALVRNKMPAAQVTVQLFSGTVDFSKWVNDNDVMRSAARILARDMMQIGDEDSVSAIGRALTSFGTQGARINGLVSIRRDHG